MEVKKIMDTFEIRDKEINSEAIKKEIQERIRKKREQGVYDKMLQEYLLSKNESIHPNRLYISLDNAKKLAELIDIDYKIESHRGTIGKLIIFVKQILRAILRLVLKPLYDRQEEFNKFILDYLRITTERIERIELERELNIPFIKDGNKD
jgi:hypothetical protein